MIRLLSHLFRDPYVNALSRRIEDMVDERNQLTLRIHDLEERDRSRESTFKWMRREWMASKAREAERVEREMNAEAAMGRIGNMVL